jgi:hypothetical protein
MVANYMNPLSADDYTCHGYVPVILGPCAMTYGCRTLYGAPCYHMLFTIFEEMLDGIFETAPLVNTAKQ